MISVGELHKMLNICF